MNVTIAIIGLFIGIMFTYINTIKVITKQDIPPGNMLAVALGWTMFIAGTWILP